MMNPSSMNKNQVDELLNEADNNYYAGKYYQAIELYEKILTISPENEHAKTYLIKTKATLIRNGSLIFLSG